MQKYKIQIFLRLNLVLKMLLKFLKINQLFCNQNNYLISNENYQV